MFEHVVTSIFSVLIPIDHSKLNIPIIENFSISRPITIDTKITEPRISAESALLLEIGNGDILYQKDPEEKRSPASLTKLVTALVVSKDEDIEDYYTIPREVADINGSRSLFMAGEKVKIRDLIAMALIESNNQAALSLAYGYSGNVYNFTREMNKFAKTLGMNDTNFVNPYGFDDPYQYSTASDLRKLALYAIRHPLLHVLSKEETKQIDEKVTLKATNQLLGTKLPGFLEIEGLKTGTTPEAGQCLITGAKTDDGKVLLAIILGSENRYSDAKKLFEYGREFIK